MYNSIVCDHCGKELPPGTTKYIVDITLFADRDGLIDDEIDIEEKIRGLINEMEKKDWKEIEEDVYEEYSLILCRRCRNRLKERLLSTADLTQERIERKETLH